MWGLTFVAIRYVHPFTELDLAIARYGIFALMSLLRMVRPRFRPRGIQPGRAVVALLLGAVGYVGYFIAASLAVRHAGAAIPPLVVGLLPVCLAIIGNRANSDVEWGRLALPLAMITVGVAVTNLWTLSNARAAGTRQGVLLGIACSFVALGHLDRVRRGQRAGNARGGKPRHAGLDRPARHRRRAGDHAAGGDGGIGRAIDVRHTALVVTGGAEFPRLGTGDGHW